MTERQKVIASRKLCEFSAKYKLPYMVWSPDADCQQMEQQCTDFCIDLKLPMPLVMCVSYWRRKKDMANDLESDACAFVVSNNNNGEGRAPAFIFFGRCVYQSGPVDFQFEEI